MTKEEIEKKAEELTQEYFQQYGGITCSWGNVTQIIQNVYKKGYKQGYKQAEKSDIKFCENICHKSDTIKLYKEQEEKIAELEKAITEKNSVIEKMKNDVRNEITRHSNFTENTLSYLLNKWS